MNVTEASQVLWDKGVRILQGNCLADTNEDHLDTLVEYMGLDDGLTIADMGCGFGEVSRWIAMKFPESYFHLVNNNEFQLGKCPTDIGLFMHHLADMCDTGLADKTMDYVMFNWSMCHVDTLCALSEAWRITKEDGRLFVYDYERLSGDNALTLDILNARFIWDSDFRRHCKVTGWGDVQTILPGGNDATFRGAIAHDELFRAITKHLRPVIWTARK